MKPSLSLARRSFTLVELLLAVAIIGILGALLLPAVNRAILTGRATRTTSNMRQIAMAVNTYAGDNDGKLPGPFPVGVYIYARKYPFSNDIPHLGNWLGQYIDAPDLPASVRTVQGIVPALQCPLLPGAAQTDPAEANYVTWDYSYNNPNSRFGGGSATPLLTMAAAQAAPYQPIRMAAMTVLAQNAPFLSTADKQIWNSTYAIHLPATGAYQGKRLWLFLDGTVQINTNSAIWTR